MINHGNQRFKTLSDRNFDNLEKLKELMGAEELLRELFQAMSAKECQENLEHISNMHDIELDVE